MSKIFSELTIDAVKNPKIACKEFIQAKLNLVELPEEKKKFMHELSTIYRRESGLYDCQIAMCKGTGCKSSGEEALYEQFDILLKKAGLRERVNITETGCRGFCEMGPLVEIFPNHVFYCKVKPTDISEIIEKTIKKGEIIKRLLFEEIPVAEEIPFYKKQVRRVLKENGHIDPENINEAVEHDAYQGFLNATQMTSSEIIDMMIDSGLRGRGGAGFPTGLKWKFAKGADSPKKYVVCNADEGDPGAFMDRSVLEGDPHKVIEGMMIAAYAIGAYEGFIYARAEYPLAIHRLEIAISQCREMGILGKNILGTGFDFDIKIMQGAGAFVCGEETALIHSIEGKRGMPTTKPPFPAVKGLWEKSTTINNVETLANVPIILRNGSDWFKSIGTEKSAGTKIFALTGKIKNTGLVEIPFGTTLKEVIYDIGGGIKDGKKFKAAQLGGPSGGCLTEAHLDLPLDYESIKSTGAMVGSGGMVILDEDTCMVETARYFMGFTQNESCGKCTFCRIGTKRMLEILEKIVAGDGEPADLEILKELADQVSQTSLCALGQSAPNPVLTTLKYFYNEYEAHVIDKKCPAKVCSNLITYQINPSLCRGCTLCALKCPVQCITGTIKQPHHIDTSACIKCGTCYRSCNFNAIEIS